MEIFSKNSGVTVTGTLALVISLPNCPSSDFNWYVSTRLLLIALQENTSGDCYVSLWTSHRCSNLPHLLIVASHLNQDTQLQSLLDMVVGLYMVNMLSSLFGDVLSLFWPQVANVMSLKSHPDPRPTHIWTGREAYCYSTKSAIIYFLIPAGHVNVGSTTHYIVCSLKPCITCKKTHL